MAFMREGILDSSVAFGAQFNLEKRIKTIGFQMTPFYHLISVAAPEATGMNVSFGHKWFFDKVPEGNLNSAYGEGSEPAPLKSWHGEELTNDYQIVKTTFGVSRTDRKASLVDGQNKLAYQKKQAILEHKISLEKILLSDQQAQKRSEQNGMVGKCAGIKSFLDVNNTIDAGGAALEWDMVRELLKIGFLKGGSPFTHIMMGDKQKDALDKYFMDKKGYFNQAVVVEDNVTTLTQTPYGNNIKIILNPYLNDDEVLALKPDDIYKVNWRAMEEREIPSSKDAEIREIISEFTLRVSTPFSVATIKGLKTTK